MKTWASVGIAPSFLTSVLDGGECSVSCSGHFTPAEVTPCTHWTGGWVGPRIGVDAVEKRKMLPCQESNLVSPAL
jgi:hypothetical protein